MGEPSVDTKSAWNDTVVAGTYTRGPSMMPAELAVFAEAWPSIRGGRVLDIGVGGGRTLPYLSGPASRYIAVDYSRAMVDACKARFPAADVRDDDARELATVADGSIDFAFFSFNSIDCVPAEGRPDVYRAVHRVLATGGRFGFSSHNARLLKHVPSKFRLPEIELTANPVRLGVRLARAGAETVRSFRNHRRLRRGERREDGYAVVNDGAHAFSMLFVYVDPAWQVNELARAGFTDIAVFDERGRRVDAAAVRDPWVHFLARKA